MGKAPGSWPVGTGYESRVGALFDPHETFTASWQLAKEGHPRPGGPCRHLLRHVKLSIKITPLAGAAFIGWWVQDTSQQAMLSGCPGPNYPYNHSD